MGAEILARLAGGALQIGGVRGGAPAITMDELMGALSGLPREQELAVRVAVCGEHALIPELERWVMHELVGVAVKQRWKTVTGKPCIRSLANYAVAELADPGSYYCRTCGGTGARTPTPKNPSDICPACRGDRTVAPSGRQMAELIGIDEANWRRTWEPRLPIARRIVQGWKEHGCRAAMRNLFPDR